MAQLDLLGTISNVSPASAITASTTPLPSGNPMLNQHETDSAKADGAYRTISEVAEELDVPTHVLRFWESRFPEVKPQRMRGGRRYYRPADVETLKRIKTLLYSQGYTIKGAKKYVKDKAAMQALQVAETPMQPPQQTVAEKAAAKKLPQELSSLLNELRDLKKTLNSFA